MASHIAAGWFIDATHATDTSENTACIPRSKMGSQGTSGRQRAGRENRAPLSPRCIRRIHPGSGDPSLEGNMRVRVGVGEVGAALVAVGGLRRRRGGGVPIGVADSLGVDSLGAAGLSPVQGRARCVRSVVVHQRHVHDHRRRGRRVNPVRIIARHRSRRRAARGRIGAHLFPALARPRRDGVPLAARGGRLGVPQELGLERDGPFLDGRRRGTRRGGVARRGRHAGAREVTVRRL